MNLFSSLTRFSRVSPPVHIQQRTVYGPHPLVYPVIEFQSSYLRLFTPSVPSPVRRLRSRCTLCENPPPTTGPTHNDIDVKTPRTAVRDKESVTSRHPRSFRRQTIVDPRYQRLRLLRPRSDFESPTMPIIGGGDPGDKEAIV
ncbi:hypothetical protein NMY22_g8335 [Coprinellus aureogranulatus]|nr:hypothetical protein NMY22_g8335 [Coprinellus aureogranulatus]